MDDHERDVRDFIKRYDGATMSALGQVICPVQIPIDKIDPEIRRVGGSCYVASFTISIADEWRHLMFPGHTGKFVPAAYVAGHEPWREVAKGRIIEVQRAEGWAQGEIYAGAGSRKGDLEEALTRLTTDDLLEIDQYGAAAKILSALVEHSVMTLAENEGLTVVRMPEDVARHVGEYYRYDYHLQNSDGATRRMEVKSLWGTDTRYARLISSQTKTNPTSSPRFDAQDIFAVSLFLRTGHIHDFAFARSVPYGPDQPYGLPRSRNYPEHVNQNPECDVGDGVWFGTIREVWDLP